MDAAFVSGPGMWRLSLVLVVTLAANLLVMLVVTLAVKLDGMLIVALEVGGPGRCMLFERRQRVAVVVCPCGCQDTACGCMTSRAFYHPLAHGVVQTLWVKWCGCLSLVIERSVRGVN